MRKKLPSRGLLTLLLACVSYFTWAQIPMVRSTFTASYTPISVVGGATVSTATGDDAVQTGIPIGFTFNYLGTDYTTIGANTNGAAGFDAAMSNTRFNPDLATSTAPNSIISAWWDDMIVDASGSILYQTQGSPGSQTFTIQWTDVLSYYTTSTQRLNYQIILYEGTNVIEFRYGPISGAGYISESASIGLKNATGGPGNYIDAVTGSSYISNSYITAGTEWPALNYRFTPGTPTAVAGGTYNVGVGQTYPSLSEAVADINHRGISGPVVLNLTDAQYDVTPANGDNMFPIAFGPVTGSSSANTITVQPASGTATISYDGASSGAMATIGTASATGTTTEPILALFGSQYISLNNLNLTCSATGIVDRGLALLNASATQGTQNCTATNISVTLNRGNTSSLGIEQRVPTTPTAPAGSNSFNTYKNLSVSNCYNGVLLSGNATYPDSACVIGNTSPTAFNSIGAASANDIGNGSSASYGIKATSQKNVSIYNNEVRNVTVTGSNTTDGIFLDLGQGLCSVYNNKVHDLKSTSTSSTSGISGIRANLATTGTNTARVYNNFVSGLSSGNTGAATATRQLKGIYAQSNGSGTTDTIDVDFNSVYLAGTYPVSSSCFEIGTSSGPIINVRNNNFVNGIAAQTSPAGHYAWASTSATNLGNTGSVSNYNNLYVMDTTQGFVGRGNTTDYKALSDWQTATTQDANSVSGDPSFAGANDLHVSGLVVNNDANSSGITWVTTDIDNDSRSATPDIGADEFQPVSIDQGVTALDSPLVSGCHSATEVVAVTVHNFSTFSHDYTTDPVTVTVNVTGAVTQTLTYTISDNSLNGGNVLPSGGNIIVPVGTIDMTAAGTYNFSGYTTVTGDANAANDTLATVTRTVSVGTATATAATLCNSGQVTLALAGNTGTFEWQSSADGVNGWTGTGSTTTPYIPTITDTTYYRALMCGTLTGNVVEGDVIHSDPPVVTADTVCGYGTVNLTASGTGDIVWFSDAGGTNRIDTGHVLTRTISTTTTYYAANSSGAVPTSVGLYDNSAGGAQQLSGNYLIFDVNSPTTLLGVYVYPGSAGDVIVDWTDGGGSVIQSATVTVGAGDVNNRTYIPLNFNLVPGTNYRLAQNGSSISMFRNSSGVNYPYTSSDNSVSITNSAAGTSFYYFFYDWQISSGCLSALTPVTAEVLQPQSISASAVTDTLCQGASTDLNVTSANASYVYTWTPSSGLSSTTGATVTATPAASIDYIVQAIDTANCTVFDTVSIVVHTIPTVTPVITANPICAGSNTSISVDDWTQPQGYTDNNVYGIPDADPTGVLSPDTVTAHGILGPGVHITSVCLDISHTWDGDLSIMLVSPNGTTVNLSLNNGGSGDNYTSTCFTPTAGQNITSGTSPFTGDWLPEDGGFGALDGEEINGVWNLFVVDGAGGDVGTINTWTITFQVDNITYTWSSTPAGFTSTSAIINVSPTATTQYTLTVADTVTGCSLDYNSTITVYDSLTLNSLSDATVCTGSSNTFNAVATGGDGNYAYLWSDNSTASSLSASTPDIYSVTVSSGCLDTVVASATLSNYAALALTSSNDTAVCSGSDATIAAIATGGDGNYSYTWDNSVAAVNQATVTPGSSTTYNVTVTEGCGESATEAVAVTVNNLPVVSLGTDITQCGGSVTLDAGNAGATYGWSTTDNTQAITASSTGNYAVTVTDGNGCSGSDDINVTINAVPVVSLGADTAQCGGSITLDAGNAGATFAWSTTETSQTITVSSTGTYQVTVTNSDNCTATDDVVVTFGTAPTVNLGTDVTQCGGSVTLDAGNTGSTYAWSSTETTQTVSVTSTGTYSVTVTNGGCSASDDVIITINPVPTVSLGSDVTQCGGTVTLDAGNAGSTYAWSNSSASQTITASSSGNYAVTVTNSSSCTASDTVSVTINTPPTATLTLPVDTACQNGGTVTLSGGSPAGGSYFGGNISGGSFDPSSATLGSNTVSYAYTDGNGCSDTAQASLIVVTCLGINEIQNGVVTLYPNPANDLVNIKIDGMNGPMDINFYDVSGRVVKTMHDGVNGLYTSTINVSEFSAGMYLIKVTVDTKTQTFNLVIQK